MRLDAPAAAVLELLREVKDPEVPVVDVVGLGIVREVEVEGRHVTVKVTPTYSGCPATLVIERDIRTALEQHGYTATVKTVFNPPWTTDWMSEEARSSLKAYGIAPPGPAAEVELVTLGGPTRAIPCPYCGSSNTTRQSEFGSTSCKSIHVCNSCRQPFEHFKPI
jgi:ring-1,2-phenylacetyl-CoA epoxidase subunit PaaD